MGDQEERDFQINVRLSKNEMAKLDAEIKRREKLDPGISFSRGEILRACFLRLIEMQANEHR